MGHTTNTLSKVMELVFATQNPNKAKEIAAKLGKEFTITDLNALGITEEIPETADTLEGNALLKARYVYARTQLNCFADDTGLEVEALNGEPGVYSARYAGLQKNADDNMELLLKNLTGKTNRKARFRTVIALIIDGKEYLFEGIAGGTIITEKKGNEGFGYDPIFIPEGYDKTFAQMSLEEKNTLSHRAKAFDKMRGFFTQKMTTKGTENIHLRLATLADVDKLYEWDKKPHVIASGADDDWVWEEAISNIVDWQEQLIAELKGEPIGVIQIIDPAREETHYWGKVAPNLRAIDIWIGEETKLNKGYGSQMMQLAIERCFAQQEVTAIIIDPLVRNTAAIRFYKRLGFEFLEKRVFGDDECEVYQLTRERWELFKESSS